ncbi:MAG: hypothetical protein JO112_20045 [Planctomycetes bacterium]|nr:hypothetical protein [Planctomycetota bacterium]
MRTTKQWWAETKSDPEKLNHWLRRQYVGEMAAVNLLSELLITYGSQATDEEWHDVHKVMCQEATHAKWMKRVMDARGVRPEEGASAERRYWNEVKPAVKSFAEGCAAGYHAEHMRLERIREIANDTDPTVADLANVFQNILPHEEWHEEVFGKMAAGRSLTEYHERGLQSLNLLMA